MTVKELISKLSTFDPDTEVFVRDRGNIYPVCSIRAQEWSFGAYGSEKTLVQKKVVTL